MKKVSAEQQAWLALQARRNLNKRIVRKKLLRERTLQGREVVLYKSGNVTKAWAERGGVQLPSDFCLNNNTDAVVTAISSIRETLFTTTRAGRRIRSGRISKWIDLASIRRISPSAALVLAAEFDRARTLSGKGLVAVDVHRWRPDVRQTLDDLGFLDLLDVENREPVVEHPGGLRIVRMMSGETVESDTAGELTQVLEGMLNDLGLPTDAAGTLQDVDTAQLYGAVIEAMENARHHAYPNDREWTYPVINRWWMTGAVDPEAKRLTVALYDQGVSIPVSLPHWQRFPSVIRAFGRFPPFSLEEDDPRYDDNAIRAAMAVSRTSTGLSYRGKGLARIEALINTCRAGRLRILSRQGEYTYQRGGKHRARILPVSIGGTLVEWEAWF